MLFKNNSIMFGVAGYVPIVVAPLGAVNVRLEEIKPSGNMIAVSAINNETFYLNGA